MNKEQILAIVEPRSVNIAIAINSWGSEGVGSQGLQAFTADYINPNYISDALTAISPAPVAPQTLTQDATATTLTPIEANYFTGLIAYCAQLISHLFG